MTEELDTLELGTLVQLIREHGGSLTPRQLQHRARRYRQSAKEARDALDQLATEGLGVWAGKSFTLNGFAAQPGPRPSLPIVLPEPNTPQGMQSDPEVKLRPEIQPTFASQPHAENALTQSQHAVTAQCTQGEVTPLALPDGGAERSEPTRDSSWAAADRRWRAEGRGIEVAEFRARIREEGKRAGMEARAARDHAWAAALAAFPPPGVEPRVPEPPAAEPRTDIEVSPREPDAGHLQGLGSIPPDWPQLPANASLPAEISWVQANRLRIVEEKSSGATVVHLDRSLSPAPSHAALGWLETSIRSYAKYVDVVARSLAVVQDEQQQERRERLALEEIDELLRGA